MVKSISHSMHWLDRLDQLITIVKAEPTKLSSISIYEIVRNFNHANDIAIVKYTSGDIAKKIGFLSKCKQEYYASARFGWIREFFSALRNQITLGVFTSSAQLGLDLSNRILEKMSSETSQTLVLNQLNQEQIEASQSEVESPSQDGERKEDIVDSKDISIVPPTLPSIDVAKDIPAPSKDISNADGSNVASQPSFNMGPSEKDEKAPESVAILQDSAKIEIQKENELTVSANDCMMETIFNLWKDLIPEDKKDLIQLWFCMMREAKVIRWEEIPSESDSKKRYYVELQNGMTGKNPKVIGNTNIRKNMVVDFFDEGDKKVICFPNHGIVHKVSLLGYSVEVPLKKIVIERSKIDESTKAIKQGMFLMIEAALGTSVIWLLSMLGKPSKLTRTPEATKNYWDNVVWQQVQ